MHNLSIGRSNGKNYIVIAKNSNRRTGEKTMALTRSFLNGMGLTGEQVSAIIEAHTETVDGLKAQRDEFKAQAEKAEADIKKLEAEGKDDSEWKQKFNDVSKEFEAYKMKQEEREVIATKEKAYKDILKAAGISEKRVEAILKVTNIKGLELDEGGKLKDIEKLTEDIKTEWSDFIVSEEAKGADVQRPPKNEGGADLSKMTMAEYIAARKKQ